MGATVRPPRPWQAIPRGAEAQSLFEGRSVPPAVLAELACLEADCDARVFPTAQRAGARAVDGLVEAGNESDVLAIAGESIATLGCEAGQWAAAHGSSHEPLRVDPLAAGAAVSHASE
eukprot:8035136-Alexandrium_andersonii.AAC.1